MRFTIKWRFVPEVASVLLAAAAILHLAHRWQALKQAGAFQRQADLARAAATHEEQVGNHSQAALELEREQTYLGRYLLASPDDIDARERLGRLMCRTAKTSKQCVEAFFVLEDVLRRDEGRDNVRRLAIDFAMDPRLTLYREAHGPLDFLIAAGRRWRLEA